MTVRVPTTVTPDPGAPHRPDAAPAGEGAATVPARYRSLFAIGRGGMGTVEVALERGGAGFQRVVALKRMLPEAARERRHTEMFLREARLAARLTHPNVVHAFHFGEEAGEPYLAMEYVEGESLAAVFRAADVRGERVPASVLAHVLAELCAGLHAAHELRDEQGAKLQVVHRDVSPHNVMVSYDGHVKLLDFGVAKIDATAGVTRTGEVKGKTAYMSPEQAMGDSLDHRSDLFSIGTLLFEGLAGRRMWGDGTDLDILRRIALAGPPRLDEAAPSTPPALVALFRRLVARAPSDRPRDAAEVERELRAFALAQLGTREAAVAATGAWMMRAFESEAAERRRALDEALREAAPTNMAVLRDSVRATSLAALMQQGTPAAAGVSKRGIVVSALIGVALAAGLTSMLVSRAATHHDTPSATASSMTASSTTHAPSAPPTNAAPSFGAPATTASAPAFAMPRVTPPAAAPSVTSKRAIARPKTPTKPATTKPIDVDPEPF